VVTSAAGGILDDSDFYPFGGERVVVASTDNPYLFTGKERDSESGLDFFGARYYSSNIGRFMIPDWAAKPTSVPYADFGNPQSLNLYTYVENNPITRFDSDGHCCEREWQYFKQELAGAWDTTGGAAVETIRQFANGQAATNVRETYFGGNVGEKLRGAGSEFFSQSVNLAKEVGSGNPRAIGQVAGIVISGKVASEARALTREATATRYMGTAEAETAGRTGSIPATDAAGQPKLIHVTTDAPVNNAATAQTIYELPATPTHRATVPLSRVEPVQPAPTGPTTSGGGTQAVTPNPIPVKTGEIVPLKKP